MTGILSDTRAISVLLHRHGALSFWDFAAAGPYVEIEMDAAPARRPTDRRELDYKDAIVAQPAQVHRRARARRASSSRGASSSATASRRRPGGGTVAYVNPLEHVYLADPEHREEGGTPAIIESIRAGLAFQLKERGRGRRRSASARRTSSTGRSRPGRREPGIGILGNPALPRLSIVSFTVRHDGRYLHHNFVVALLNDLFGIQSRGGCSCAGPYGHRLLGIDIETSHAFEREISRGCEGIKPGWVRVNFNYFISEAVFDVHRPRRSRWSPATAGGSLPWYRFEPATGMWRHAAGSPEPPLSLHDITFRRGRARLSGASPPRARSAPGRPPRPRPSGSWPTRSRSSARRRDPEPLARRRRTSSRSAGSGCRTRSPPVAEARADPISSGGRAGARGRRWPCRRRP